MERLESQKSRKCSKKSSNGKSSITDPPKIYSKPSKTSTATPHTVKKVKLRTSKDVYDRLKWDMGSLDINLSDLYIGYKDRFLGMCELKFTDFNPCAEEGDIPFHRIYYFRGGGPPVDPFVGKDGEVRVREDNWPPNAVIYWDRETRRDLIFNSGETFSQPINVEKKESHMAPSGYSIQSSYQYKEITHAWEVSNSKCQSVLTKKNLKLLSLNILYELYDPEMVVSYRRWPYLLDFLEDSDADIIALQEVTPAFLSVLETQRWVQKKYYLTEISTVGKTIQPYGQILITKFEPQQVCFIEEAKKRFIISRFKFQNLQEPLIIANIHLKSNYKGNCSGMRQKQMNRLLAALSELDRYQSSEIVIVGDTNFVNDETIDCTNSKLKLVDAWNLLMSDSDDPGWTFDITTNNLAAKLSCGAERERFDRVFVKAEQRHWLEPRGIEVSGRSIIDFFKIPRARHNNFEEAGDSRFENLSLSDHFTLICDFDLPIDPSTQSQQSVVHEMELNYVSLKHPTVEKFSPVHTSAVSIVPPEDLWPQIQAIRSEFDPSFTRWPPHINLIYGFIPNIDRNFIEAQEVFTESIKYWSQFSITLSKIDIFQNSSYTSVYLAPSDDEAMKIRHLQRQLTEEYPDCKNLSTHYNPHLTIAKLPTGTPEEREILSRHIKEWKETLLGQPANNILSFPIDRIYLMSREQDFPFSITRTVVFGTPNETKVSSKEIEVDFIEDFLYQKSLVPTPNRVIDQVKIMRQVQLLCRKAVEKVSVHLTGSSFMGFHDESSDIDILACGPPDVNYEAFFHSLKSVATEASANTFESQLCLVSIVLNTLVPIARLRMNSIDIDLVYCPCGPTNWDKVTDEELAQESETYVRSLDGVREAAALLQLISQEWWPVYCACVRALKYWAKKRKIYSKCMGYISSNTISLLVAYTILHKRSPQVLTSQQLIIHFFKQFSVWKWPTPVTFGLKQSGSTHVQLFKSNIPELMPICAPCFPYLNRARNVSRNTRTLIQRELIRGNEIISQNSSNFEEKWDSLCKIQNFFEAYPLYIQIQLKCKNEQDLEVCKGILQSRLINLIVQLEMSIFCQPCTKLFVEDGNCLTGFIGCAPSDLLITPSQLPKLTANFKPKIEKWIRNFVNSTVEIRIHELKNGARELKKFHIQEMDYCDSFSNEEVTKLAHAQYRADDVSDAEDMTTYTNKTIKLLGIGLATISIFCVAKYIWNLKH